MSKDKTSQLISCIGLANTIGRVGFGFIADKPEVNRLMVYSFCLTICGISTAVCGFLVDFWQLVAYAIIFGISTAAFVVLTSVIVVDLIGLDEMANGFGLVLLFQGVSTFFGQPFGAFLNSTFENYSPAFMFSGICICFGGFMVLLIPILQKHSKTEQTSV